MLQITMVISLSETPLPKERGKQDPQEAEILSPVIFCLWIIKLCLSLLLYLITTGSQWNVEQPLFSLSNKDIS